MFFFREPTTERIDAILETGRTLSLTYPDVRATASSPPAGHTVDHNRLLLGAGEETFRAARSAVSQWRQFDFDWLHVHRSDAPIAAGGVVAVLARALGCWSLTPCRIVYVINDADRYGFAWGTLPGHFAQGEERFLVEWNPVSGEVHYDLLAFSLPANWIAHLGFYYLRRVQKRFARCSKQAMLRAVQQPAG